MLSPLRLFLWSLAITSFLSSPSLAQESDIQANDEFDPSQQRRELWDFFSLLAVVHDVIGCPPGPLGKPCRDKKAETSVEGVTKYNVNSANSDNSGTSSSSGSSSSATGSDEYRGQQTAGGGGFEAATNGLEAWMFLVAGSILSALVAVHMGQRRPALGEGRHGLSGAVAKRFGTVSAFASGAMADAPKDIEMQGQEVKTGLQMDMGPEGVEATPSYEMA